MIKAELISHMGDDLTVVNAARVSLDKESEWEDHYLDASKVSMGTELLFHKLKPEDIKLISYLAKHQHTTPFTHPQITLRETIPIFVARQRFKHVVGFTYNEVSRRYVDTPPEFYVPDEWRSRPEGSIKQGSGGKTVVGNSIWGFSNGISSDYEDVIGDCVALYNSMIEQGVAPEQARMVLPQSMLTSYYVTGSLAAFARAYKQRIDSHAQKEIQILAEQWSNIISPLYPVSWAALISKN